MQEILRKTCRATTKSLSRMTCSESLPHTQFLLRAVQLEHSTVLISANNILKSTYVSSLLVAFKGQLKDIKTCGTFFISSWSSELFDGLYFDDVKSADFGSEKKILV